MSDDDYIELLAEVEFLVGLDPEIGTDEAERLDAISRVIEDYERDRYPLGTETSVYVVESGDYDELFVSGVFDSQQKAIDYVKKEGPTFIGRLIHARIVIWEYTLNDGYASGEGFPRRNPIVFGKRHTEDGIECAQEDASTAEK